jgi:hypothetical protein
METEESLIQLQAIAVGPYPSSLETSPNSKNLLTCGKFENRSPTYIKCSGIHRGRRINDGSGLSLYAPPYLLCLQGSNMHLQTESL